MAEFKMPSLGADMKDAVLLTWNVKEGDHVTKGDIIADIETDKGDIDVEVFETGTIQKIVAKPGERLDVGAVLAIIQPEGGEAYVVNNSVEKKENTEAKPKRIKVSPLARRIASDLGVDLNLIPVKKEGATIHKEDVEKFFEAQKTTQAREEPASKIILPKEKNPAAKGEGMRRAIAKAMSRSNKEIPHYYLETPIDMSASLEWLQSENQHRQVKDRLLLPALLLKAVAKALNDVPELNAYWEGEESVIQEAVHVGFAISLRKGGLVIPAIHHADMKSMDEIMASLTDITRRSRSGKLKSSELTDGTITITSLGDRGVEKVFGVIYPPQVALIGFGKIMEKPWASNGMLGVKPILVATLAADHRATDGKIGASFLRALETYLSNPNEL